VSSFALPAARRNSSSDDFRNRFAGSL